MGLISKIQERAGLSVGIIAVALILFILGSDLFTGNNGLFRGQGNAGEINGSSISTKEYQESYAKNEMQFETQTDKPVGESERASVEYQAWNDLIIKYALKPQYEEAGVAVSPEERKDLFYGKFVHQNIKQAFGGGPDFSGEQVANFVRNIEDAKADQNPQVFSLRAKWAIIKERTVESREKEKYFMVLKKSEYVTNEEAKRYYTEQNEKAEVKFLYVPYSTINDTAVKVNDDQIEDYIARNEKNYQVEDGRSLDYVIFNIAPTAEDSANTQNQLSEFVTRFKETKEDSSFVQDVSEVPNPPKYMGVNELPDALKGQDLAKDSVYGPVFSNGRYALYKVLGTKSDTVYSLRASHILFRIDANKDSARIKANKVLAEIKAGADFSEMARQYGTDGTSTKGGDLGWFSNTGQMVKPFETACFNFKGTGVLPNLVETQFGYHIIKITEPKTNKKYLVATVEKELSTMLGKDVAYNAASAFAGAVEDTASFNAEAKKNPAIQKYSYANAGKNDRSLTAINNAKEIIRWAYTDAKIGEPSKVFAIDNQYIVAILTKKRDKGLASPDDVRAEVTTKVRNELKGDQILEKLNKQSGDLEKIGQGYGPEAVFGNAQDVTFSSTSIGSVGYDPVATGKLFALKPGKRTQAFKGENGVVILELVKTTPAPEVADYNQYKTQKEQQRSGSVDYYAEEAVKKIAEVEDERYKF